MRGDLQMRLTAVRGAALRRAYEVSLSRDLFGHLVLDLTWSRIGRRGQQLRLSAPTEQAAERLLRERLQRRASLPRRAGARYALTLLRGDASWLARCPSFAPLGPP